MKNSTFINQTIRIAEIIKSGFSASLFTLVLGGFLSPVPVMAQHGDREFRNRENDQRDRVEQPRHENRDNHNNYDNKQRYNQPPRTEMRRYPGNPAPRPRYVERNTVIIDRSRPSWQYASLPRRNTVIQAVPSTSVSIAFGGINFRYNNGIYYKPYRNTYIVAPPPFGIRVRYLPVGFRVVNVYNRTYNYYNGAYYEPVGNEYVVVPPPVGALVESIPDGYETLQINGETYYIVDGVQYRAVINNGEIWYEVIKVG